MKLTNEQLQLIKDNCCIFCGTPTNEDLRKWFGKGGAGGTTKGGWDRYSTTGKKLGKCGDGKEGGAYAACLSATKARKLGKKGIANFNPCIVPFGFSSVYKSECDEEPLCCPFFLGILGFFFSNKSIKFITYLF